MPFNVSDEHRLRHEKAARRQAMAEIRAALRPLNPGESRIIPWQNGRDQRAFRRDVIWAAYLIWGARAATVTVETHGVMVQRHE